MSDSASEDRFSAEAAAVGALPRVVAALAFAGDEPVTAERAAQAYGAVTGEPVDAADVDAAVEAFNAAAEAGNGPFRLERWGGGYRAATTPDLAPFVRVFLEEDRKMKLSRSLMETLAILAYKQPATKPEVDFVRGVDADYALRKLLDLGLIDVVGRSDALGRPLLYGTTPRFLEQFGIDALDTLPRLREIEDLLDDPQFNRERARLLALDGLAPSGGDDVEQPPPSGVDTADEEPSD